MEVLATSFSAATTKTGDTLEYMRGQAEELEAVFLNTLVSEMFASTKSEEDAFGGGYAEETWRGMQSEQFAAAMAKSGGIGIADQIMRSLLGAQEFAQQQTQQSAATTNPYSPSQSGSQS